MSLTTKSRREIVFLATHLKGTKISPAAIAKYIRCSVNTEKHWLEVYKGTGPKLFSQKRPLYCWTGHPHEYGNGKVRGQYSELSNIHAKFIFGVVFQYMALVASTCSRGIWMPTYYALFTKNHYYLLQQIGLDPISTTGYCRRITIQNTPARKLVGGGRLMVLFVCPGLHNLQTRIQSRMFGWL